MKLFEEETHGILLKFLDSKIRKAEDEIEKKGVLSDEFAIPILLKTQFNHIAHLDEAVSEIQKNMVTKDDLKGMLTKDDLKGMATKDDIEYMVVKDDLKGMATKDDIKYMVVKDDIKYMVVKDDIKHLENRNNWTLALLSIVIMLIAFVMPVYLQYLVK